MDQSGYLREIEGLEAKIAELKEALARALELRRQAEEVCVRRTQERDALQARLDIIGMQPK